MKDNIVLVVPARTLRRCRTTESQFAAGYNGLFPWTDHRGNPTCHLSERPVRLLGKRSSARIATLSGGYSFASDFHRVHASQTYLSWPWRIAQNSSCRDCGTQSET